MVHLKKLFEVITRTKISCCLCIQNIYKNTKIMIRLENITTKSFAVMKIKTKMLFITNSAQDLHLGSSKKEKTYRNGYRYRQPMCEYFVFSWWSINYCQLRGKYRQNLKETQRRISWARKRRLVVSRIIWKNERQIET